MADISNPTKSRFPKLDGAWTTIALLILGTAIFVPSDLGDIVQSAVGNILHTGRNIAALNVIQMRVK